MIDINARKSILRKLAKRDDKGVQDTLKQELEKARKIFCEAADYQTLSDRIDLFDTFAYRLPEESLSILDFFLERLKTLELSYKTLPIESETMARFYSKGKLVGSVLESYQKLRYFNVRKTIETFLKYGINDDEIIQKKAIASLESVVEYNIEVYEKIGLSVQTEAVSTIQTLSNQDKQRFFNSLIVICKKLLSPELKQTSFSQASVTFTSASHPPSTTIESIRQKTLGFLENIYPIAKDLDEKKSVIDALQHASRTPRRQRDEKVGRLDEIIRQDVQHVLEILGRIVETEEDLQLIQEIEHDAYWIHYHFADSVSRESACAVKKIIDGNEEYQIFKVLIGFRGVFHAWCEQGTTQDFSNNPSQETAKVNERREEKFQQIISAVCQENYGQWEQRIITWAEIRSNDLLMFPYFLRFLESIGKQSPDFALQLLNQNAQQLGRFAALLLIGGLESEQNHEFQAVMESWLSEEKHLWVIARVCKHAKNFDAQLLEKVTNIALKQKDRITLCECSSAIFFQFNQGGDHLVNSLFPQIIDLLTDFNDTRWIHNIWHQKSRESLIQAMEGSTIDSVLSNLIYLERIDYETEDLIASIAEKNAEKILCFFGKRLDFKSGEASQNDYQPIPFGFDQLQAPLSKSPKQALTIVRQWYNNDSRSFSYFGGKLVSDIFPEFGEPIQNEILEILKKGGKEDQEFVLSLLQNYSGQPNTHAVVAELIKGLPEDSQTLNEIMVFLQKTGAVFGEYGFSEAYKRKKSEIQHWIENDNPKIRTFAEKYLAMLDRMIDDEEQRAEERATLRKYQDKARE